MQVLQISTLFLVIASRPQPSPTFYYILEVSLQHQIYIFIPLMNQLKKIKSQELIDRLFNNNLKQNYYEHHHLPARTTNRNFFTKTTSLMKDNKQIKQKEKSKQKVSHIQIGRQLYPELIKRVEDPGPGAYDWQLPEPKGYRFTVSSSSLGKKRILKVRSKQDKVGPGFYKYDEVANMNILSQNRKSLVAKITKSPKKQDRLVYRINDVPGPGRYENSSNLQKISNFQECNSHKISITARSSIVRKEQYPGGPGFYNWEEFYEKNKQKKKPCIEYKFVYGHAS